MCFAITGMFGGIYGVNGRFLEIKDLTSCFKAVQCPSLAGNPSYSSYRLAREEQNNKVFITELIVDK